MSAPAKSAEPVKSADAVKSAEPVKSADANECPPGKSCVVRNIVKTYLLEPSQIANKMEAEFNKKVDAKVTSFKDGVKDILYNPVECAKNVGSVIPNMIENSFNKFANGIDKVGNSFINATENTVEAAFKDPLAPIRVFVFQKSQDLQDLISKIVFGKDGPSMMKDPNMNPDKIVEDILKTTQAYQKIIDTPIFQKMFKEWIQSYAEMLDKAIMIGKPEIDKITGKLTGIVDDTSKKIGEALTNSLSNIIGTALKSIPFAGTIFNIGDLAQKMAIRIMSLCEPLITKGGVSLITAANATADQINNAKCKIDELTKKISSILPSQVGGGRNNKKKIMRATKRLNKMLRKFSKNPHKINYKYRLNNTLKLRK